MKFEDRLKKLMASRGVTQSTLADAVGVSQGALSNYISGRLPKVEELGTLADFFEVSIDELLGRSATKLTQIQSRGIVVQERTDKKAIAKLRRLVAELTSTIDELESSSAPLSDEQQLARLAAGEKAGRH